MATAFSTAEHKAAAAQYGNRFYAVILASLCVLFGLRVLGQAIQRWAPLPFLPSFDALQGSDLPYGLLLPTQLVLMALMIGVTSRVSWGALRKSARAARMLGVCGAIYMAGSIARIAVALTLSEPPAWFADWIAAVFHIALAAFGLTLAAYHAAQDREVSS